MTTTFRRSALGRAVLIGSVLTLAACSSSDDDGTTTGDATTDPVVDGTTYEVTLSPLQEVPPVSGADGAGGTGTLVVDMATGTLAATVTPTGLTGEAQAAHIHQAMGGAAGDVIVTLEDPDADGTFTEPADGATLTAEQLRSLETGGLYFNVHTAANPDGEVRGQIVPEDVFFRVVEASGAQEAPEPVTTEATGVGVITIQPDGATAAALFARGIGGEASDKAAHVHRGVTGEAGDVILALTLADGEDGGDDTLDVWRTAVDANLDTESRAGGLYFNAHSTDYPAGEIRAQIKDAD